MFRLVVLSVVLAVSAAQNLNAWGAGLGWGAPWTGAGVVAPLAGPIFNPLGAQVGPNPNVGALNYRGPLSLAPGQPANILAADGRPLDTLSVNLDRAVHYQAKALESSHGHRLKRSVLGAGVAAQLASPLVAAPLTQGRTWVGPASIAPVAIPVATAPLGFGVGVGVGVGNIW